MYLAVNLLISSLINKTIIKGNRVLTIRPYVSGEYKEQYIKKAQIMNTTI